MRQDAVEKFADDGDTPGFRELLKRGAHASDNGLLTQAPPNTGAGWFTLTHRRLAGRARLDQQHVPHQRRGLRATRPAAFSTPSILQAETLAQAAERGGKKVAQIEWAGGRSGSINGPDARLPQLPLRPRRGDQLHRAAGQPAVRRPASALQFDHPAGFAGSRRSRRRPRDATGWTNVPRSYSPAKEMRLRVLDGNPAVDKYGLNAYIYDCQERPQDALRPRALQPHQGRRRQGRRPRGRRVGRREGQDHRRATRSTARPARSWSRSSGSTRTSPTSACSTRRSRARSRSGRTGPASPASPARFEDYVAEKFPSSQAGDFAVLESGHRQRGHLHRAGPVLGEALPPADQVRARQVQAGPGDGRLPGHRRGPAPVPRAGHEEAAQRRQRTRPTTTSRSTARRTAASTQREAYIREAYEGSDATMRLAQDAMRDRDLNDVRRLRPRLRAAVRWRSTPARCSSTSACSPRRRPATAARPTGETIGKAKACWAGGAVQIYLNLAGPRPGAVAPAPFKQVPAADEARDGRARSRPRSSRSRTPTTGPATASPRAGR